MKALLAPFALLLALPFAASCGDDDDGPSPYRSGVKEDGPVNRLPEEDLQQLCRSFEAHVNLSLGYDTLAHVVCLPRAILFGGTPDGCQRLLDECLDDLPPPAQLIIDVHNERECIDDLRRCNASVVELEGCVDVNLDWAYQLVRSVSCGSFTDRDRRDVERNMVGGCVDTSPGCRDFADVNDNPTVL